MPGVHKVRLEQAHDLACCHNACRDGRSQKQQALTTKNNVVVNGDPLLGVWPRVSVLRVNHLRLPWFSVFVKKHTQVASAC